MPAPGAASNGAPPTLGATERDTSRATLLFFQVPVTGPEAHHADNHQGREENGGTIDAHNGAHHKVQVTPRQAGVARQERSLCRSL